MRTKNPEYFKMIEEFIDDYREKNGVSPTVREIHAGIGLAVGTVSRYDHGGKCHSLRIHRGLHRRPRYQI